MWCVLALTLALASASALPLLPSDIPAECFVTWTPPGQSPAEAPAQPIQCRPHDQPDHCPQETKDLDRCPPAAFVRPVLPPPQSDHVDQKPPPVAELPPDEVKPEPEVILSPPANLRVCLQSSEREGKDGFCVPSIKPPTCTNDDWESVVRQFPDIKHNCDHHIQTRDVSVKPSEYFDCYKVITAEDNSKTYCLPKDKPNTCAADEWQEVNEKAPKEHHCADNNQNKQDERSSRQIKPLHEACFEYNNETNTFCKPETKPDECLDRDWKIVVHSPFEKPCKKPEEDKDEEEEHTRRKRQDDSLRDDESVQLISGHKKCVVVEKPPPTPEEVEKTEFCLPKVKPDDCDQQVLDKIKKVFSHQCQ